MFWTWLISSLIDLIFVASCIFNNDNKSTNEASEFKANKCFASANTLKNLSNNNTSNLGSLFNILSFKYIAISSHTEEASYSSNLWIISLISFLFKTVSKIVSIKSGSINPSISTTQDLVTFPFEKIIAWSKSVKVSLKLPCPDRARISKLSVSKSIPSSFKIWDKWWITSLFEILLNLKCWVLERIVAGNFKASVVAKINFTNPGGSSSVFNKALKAAVVNICTSSIINTLNLADEGLYFVCSIKSLISSIPLFEAASISITSKWELLFVDSQWEHFSQGFDVGPFSHKSAFAIILAVEVFPLPRRPENKYACDNLLVSKAKESVWEIVSCPTKSSNLFGLYFNANTLFASSIYLLPFDIYNS